MPHEVTRLQIDLHGAHRANEGLQAEQTNLRSEIAQRLERNAEKEQLITHFQRVACHVANREAQRKKLLVYLGVEDPGAGCQHFQPGSPTSLSLRLAGILVATDSAEEEACSPCSPCSPKERRRSEKYPNYSDDEGWNARAKLLENHPDLKLRNAFLESSQRRQRRVAAERYLAEIQQCLGPTLLSLLPAQSSDLEISPFMPKLGTQRLQP